MSIFLDFDGTITAQDTITHLSNFALGIRASEGQDLKQQWSQVVKSYVDDHGNHVSSYVPHEDARSLPEHEVAFLRDLKTVEKRSLVRINACALFRGIGDEAFRDAGRRLVEEGTVRLRDGFAEFVAKRRAEGWRVWVLSVNWSSAFIEGACGGLEGVEVISNDVREDGSIAGPGVLNTHLEDVRSCAVVGEQRNLTNSRDKLDAMEAVLAAEGLSTKPSVYFGDSTTDLECLLAADRGYVISDKDDSSLLETLRRIGKEVPHVRDRDQSTAGKLAWTSNYEDIAFPSYESILR
ncbi:haloacid dehalogenase-like hydrolase-domain-containing protein [Annulohypoxylon maeteangense]|uniref:haloacid dehalogenase-like hydrolase-domain-containing protein n=1 Tax=Annulohypoxylon maeteangense TaxID=1927788 RepID=UPI002007A1AB|nr:haloacid dehalogenase-like hydrolase-domain-containing protein [Annulohypoxylon maeteangense]KAI0888636.1 haloacid dehalogenase-like hydrolase-domain-containing protein [Annulohypoxylon maeteangense]